MSFKIRWTEKATSRTGFVSYAGGDDKQFSSQEGAESYAEGLRASSKYKQYAITVESTTPEQRSRKFIEG